MTVEIFFSDDSSAWEEEEKRHQLPFFPQSIKEGLPIVCNVCASSMYVCNLPFMRSQIGQK